MIHLSIQDNAPVEFFRQVFFYKKNHSELFKQIKRR